MYLVQVDDGLPEVVLLLVEVSHTDLTEVTGVVLFHSQPFPSLRRHFCCILRGSRTLSMLVRWWC